MVWMKGEKMEEGEESKGGGKVASRVNSVK